MARGTRDPDMPMRNLEAEIRDGKLILEIDLEAEAIKSPSGDSFSLASTRGNRLIKVGERKVYFNLNAWVYE